LKKNNGDEHEIKEHFSKALDMGKDPTEEAILALGQRNMSVIRALNRQYYQSSQAGGTAESSGGGGIMSGGGVGSSSSVFAPQAKHEEAAVQQSDTLTLLEQGASSYDSSSPMGGQVEGESSLEHLKAKKESKESTLNDLRR
jgi:hypothetical protein